ncbi:hypothetical protein TorRG33x02_157910 [Trema orientale]|uniref:Mediator of RNA polymerase II transcription subunit n=1 Tax=Trema orientale TaxID=63057 RepID=A0A2P5ESH7_TREOI|nr:hypothetical protein TorRG33x02_157910 [Trema orientale]
MIRLRLMSIIGFSGEIREDILQQYSMVNLELFKIVDEIKKVSGAFVVHPKNVNAENSTILSVMLSSKLLQENIETDDNLKKDQLLHGMQNLPVSSQIERSRIDMIGAACESAEKILADTRKALLFWNSARATHCSDSGLGPTSQNSRAGKFTPSCCELW